MIYKDSRLHIPSCKIHEPQKYALWKLGFYKFLSLRVKRGSCFSFWNKASSLSGGSWSCHLWAESRKSCWVKVYPSRMARLHNRNCGVLQSQSITECRPLIRFCEVSLHATLSTSQETNLPQSVKSMGEMIQIRSSRLSACFWGLV